MKRTITLMFLLNFSTLAETVKIHVPGMVCQMCVQGMQKQFKSVVKDAEKDVLVELDTKVVTVTTIAPITDKDIKERVNNAGYNAEKITRIKDKKSE
jgi:copper chaperone CopZ